MPFTLLQVAESQLGEFMATESAGQQDGKQRRSRLPFSRFPTDGTVFSEG
jgi:hypothetical protein